MNFHPRIKITHPSCNATLAIAAHIVNERVYDMPPVLSKGGAAEDRDQTPPTRSCLVSFKVNE